MVEKASDLIVIVVAAGIGSRCGTDLPKQYLALGEGTVLTHAVRALQAGTGSQTVYIAVREDDRQIEALDLTGCHILRTGGKTREETVYKTLLAVSDFATESTLVLVHDAARPMVKPEDVSKLLTLAKDASATSPLHGAVLAMAVSDTVKRIDTDGNLIEDIEREGLVRVATPQVFRYGTLLKALSGHLDATDESSAVRAIGGKVKVLTGSAMNFKITQREDWLMSERLLRGKIAMHSSGLRVGVGYDSHRLVAGRKLILAGVKVEHTLGLEGHSDADVLTHAIIDALLGAAGCGNIGLLFPDDEAAYKDADSMALLGRVVERLSSQGYRIVNVDTVLIAQAPKLNPYLPRMLERLSSVLLTDAVNIKPKTNERMGFEGREEGISAEAVVLLEKTTKEKR